MADEQTQARKILREYGSVQMWQEYIAGPHRRQVLRYFVARQGQHAAEFTAPHLAFAHFQELTGAPTSAPTPPAPQKRRSTDLK
jgi:hypothetical protein